MGSKPVSMPEVATRRPTAVHTSPASCKLRSHAWGIGLPVPTGPVFRHRTPAAPPLGTGKLPFFGRCSLSCSESPGALSQMHLGERKKTKKTKRCSAGGHPWTPPSRVPLLPRPAQGLGPRHLPNFQMTTSASPEGERGLHARLPRPLGPRSTRPLTRPLPRPPAARRFLRRVSSACRSHIHGRGGTICSRPSSHGLGLRRRAPSAAATPARAGLSHGGCILTKPTAVLMP